ncbi:aminotransferase class I/II-fold pyridoxal phosphate-dependent enzyme [Parapedobacter sp. ISTM3]|uniref:L-threonine aldolase n=1 Tax=Parapedobacter luteus TaxID=623280 RepID=A0A1T5DUG3_9SPHI|nr:MULTISPECIES: aminotransferase class I/II-fold pyridoxal phosphate-dependent enzyme [Parapedobacter]MBK1440786.1 aminotransferase class I/II-fold pyridoxal phosphate-dependent enzyme [Parapedobacter sp. ISTM3]SKB75432.1 L-threonine aldolase [Parapedobacter luteus]
MNPYRYYFRDDYSEGCHPQILKALQETSLSQQIGYGHDDYSIEAKDLIKQLIPDQDADIHFVSGGTQANLIVIAAALRSYESVISAQTGHINGHEGGAIEASGHRVEAISTADGKLDVAHLSPLLAQLNVVGSTQPRMVYISNTTELGTVYSKAELTALSAFCREQGWYLYLDGARLPAALTAPGNDLTLQDVAELTDAFYIGGTKNGALLGEAIVITHPELKTGFKHYLKQKGAMLAKGRVLGLQFRELFRDNLIFDLAAHANACALSMVPAIEKLGYTFRVIPASNQLFPILPDLVVDELAKNYLFHRWEQIANGHTVIRLVTSWATPKTVCDRFISDLELLTSNHRR